MTFWQYVVHTEWVHFAIYYVLIAFIGGMPAPTKDSSVGYQWAFKSFNILGANLARASGPTVEKSPNFQDALNLQQAAAGQAQTPVVPPVLLK